VRTENDVARRNPTSRRERLEQMRREQQRAERRRTLVIITTAVLVGVVIIGAAAWVPVNNWINDPRREPMSAFGVPAGEAGLSAVTNDSGAGVADHVPTGENVDYDTAPPSAGPHWEAPAPFDRKFYTTDDRPDLETLVHNLEHGYTIVWYDETIAADDAQMADLRDIARRFESSQPDNAKKLIVAPWTADDGDPFPKGKHLAFTHWSRGAGHRQYSTRVSGEALERFMKKYPAEDSPEPYAA
jgi:hypothetical protein